MGKHRSEYFSGHAFLPSWRARDLDDLVEEIAAPYSGDGSSSDDSQLSDAELAQESGYELFIIKETVCYGNKPRRLSVRRRTEERCTITNVSRFPVDDKVLVKNGSDNLSDAAMSFIKRFSKFIRTQNLFIMEGGFGQLTKICTGRRDRKKPILIVGDRPFPYIPPEGSGETFEVVRTMDLSGREIKFVSPSQSSRAQNLDGQLVYVL